MEREITEPVDMWRADGELAPEAIGWSRGPLHRCRLPGPWGRRKHWHYWCVTSPAEIVCLTLADLDYVGLATIMVYDLASGRVWRDARVRPLGWPIDYPDRADRGRVAIERGGFELVFDDHGDRATLGARGRKLALQIDVVRPTGHETLGVAIARTAADGRYTSKHNTLPARGWLELDGVRRPIGAGAFACLDWGRGVWPTHTRWNWASASGVCDGRVVGINLGARWTDGGGPTENALCLDGRLHKLAGDVRFDWDRRTPRRPWRLTGDGVDLTLSPAIIEGVAGPRGGPLPLRLCFGRFHGRVLDTVVRDLPGWAEELDVRW